MALNEKIQNKYRDVYEPNKTVKRVERHSPDLKLANVNFESRSKL